MSGYAHTLVIALPPLMGVVAYIGLHHLWLWAARRREVLHLWVGGWCLLTLLYLISHYAQITTSDGHRAVLASRLMWTSAVLLIPVLAGLIHALAGRPPRRGLMLSLAGLTVFLVAALWLTGAITSDRPYTRVDSAGNPYQAPLPGPWMPALAPYFVAVFVYTFHRVWRSTTLERGERRAVLGGFFLYVLLGVNDTLRAARVIDGPPLFDYAFVAVGVGLTYLLVRRSTILSTRLEDQVAARTEELELERDKLVRANEALDGALDESRAAHHEARRRGDELTALLAAGQSVMAGLELRVTLQRMVEEASRIAGTSSVEALLIDTEARALRVGASTGRPFPPGYQVPLGSGLAGMVAVTGRPLLVPDVHAGPARVDDRERWDGVATFLGLPIASRDEVLGVLSFSTASPRAYSPEDLAYLSSFAQMAAIAIQNAHLYDAAREQSRELAALHEVRTVLGSTLDTGSVLETIAEWAVRLTGADGSCVFELDPTDGILYRRAARGAGEAGLPMIVLGQGAAGGAALERRPVSSRDIRSEPLPGYEDELIGTGRLLREVMNDRPYRAILGMPLEHREAVFGAICLYWNAVHVPTEREIRLLRAFGQQAAGALEHGRLYEALEERVRGLEALTGVNELISSSLDRDEVLREISRAAARLMKVPLAHISVVDEDRRTLEIVAFSDPGIGADFPFRTVAFDQGILGWIATHREAVNVGNVFADDRFVALSWWRRHGFHSFYGVPVIIDGALLAVLSLNGRRPFALGPDEHDLLGSFVAQAAMAIRNASRYRAEGEARRAAELALAHVRQLQGLLPICSYCKKIRNDRNYWEQIETYISQRSEAAFSHSICPECRENVVAPQLAEWRRACELDA